MNEQPKPTPVKMQLSVAAVVGIAAVVGVAAFFGGMKYGQAHQSAAASRNGGNFANGQSGQRFFNGAVGGQNGGQFGGGMRGNRNGSGFVGGEIIAKDDKSVTVKLNDGGSKIVFLSDITEVSKFVAGAATDLEVGKNVMVTGTPNADGSLTAKTIQLRPVLPQGQAPAPAVGQPQP